MGAQVCESPKPTLHAEDGDAGVSIPLPSSLSFLRVRLKVPFLKALPLDDCPFSFKPDLWSFGYS